MSCRTGRSLLLALLGACLVPARGAPPSAPAPWGGPPPILPAAEVEAVVRRAALAVEGERMAVAVVDRAGRLIGLWHRAEAAAAEDELALALARTGAFFGQDQAPLTSRTVRFISGIHFPPGVRNQPAGPLYGIENTNRVDRRVNWLPGQEFPPPLNVEGIGPGRGIATGKRDERDSEPRAVNPGGVPIVRAGRVVGGVGVAGIAPAAAEYAAVRAAPYPTLGPGAAIFIEGIGLPLVVHRRLPRGAAPGDYPGTGTWRVPPADAGPTPEGWLSGPSGGTGLSRDEVESIVLRSIDAASRTRAAIRLPRGSRTRMVIAVGDLDGTILGLYRMPDSTVFSLDVAAAKARNVVYFSGPDRLPGELPGLPVGTAVTTRTLGFGAQPLYRPGIDGTARGPFWELFLFDTANPGTQGAQPPNANQNGIVFFPGSVPLYRGGRLAGGLGISGDGVDQDDLVAFHGARGFEAPAALRADRFVIRGARLPYLKFPRNPLD